jgi:hypothetical protein
MQIKVPNFKSFMINESVERLSLPERVEMAALGLGGTGIKLLRADVQWASIDAPYFRYGGAGNAFINWSLWYGWPIDKQVADIWSDYVTDIDGLAEILGKPGDTELVDEYLLDTARYFNAHALWCSLDNIWFDVETGEVIPDLRRFI